MIRIREVDENADYNANGYKLGSDMISAINKSPAQASSYPAGRQVLWHQPLDQQFKPLQSSEPREGMAGACIQVVLLSICKTDKTNGKIDYGLSVGNPYLRIVKQYLVILLMMLSTLVASAQGRKTDNAMTDKEQIARLIGRSRVNAAVYGGGRHTWPLQMDSKLERIGGQWKITWTKASTY